MQTYADQIFKTAKAVPEYSQMFQITGIPTVNAGTGSMLLKSWGDRGRIAKEIQKNLQVKWNEIAGVRVAAFQFPALPGSSSLPLQFVITTTEPFENLNTIAQLVLDKVRASGKFYFIDTALRLTNRKLRWCWIVIRLRHLAW